MEAPSSSSSPMSENPRPSLPATSITDVNVDSLAQCAGYLSLRDLSNMSMTCTYLKKVAYSDSIWQRWFRSNYTLFQILFPYALSTSCIFLFTENSFKFICCRESWPGQTPPATSQTAGVREAYLCRRKDLLQFKFINPLVADFYTNSSPFDHVLLDNNNIIFSQVISCVTLSFP